MTLYKVFYGAHPYPAESGKTPDEVRKGTHMPDFAPVRDCAHASWTRGEAGALCRSFLQALLDRQLDSRSMAPEALSHTFLAPRQAAREETTPEASDGVPYGGAVMWPEASLDDCLFTFAGPDPSDATKASGESLHYFSTDSTLAPSILCPDLSGAVTPVTLQ